MVGLFCLNTFLCNFLVLMQDSLITWSRPIDVLFFIFILDRVPLTPAGWLFQSWDFRHPSRFHSEKRVPALKWRLWEDVLVVLHRYLHFYCHHTAQEYWQGWNIEKLVPKVSLDMHCMCSVGSNQGLLEQFHWLWLNASKKELNSSDFQSSSLLVWKLIWCLDFCGGVLISCLCLMTPSAPEPTQQTLKKDFTLSLSEEVSVSPLMSMS